MTVKVKERLIGVIVTLATAIIVFFSSTWIESLVTKAEFNALESKLEFIHDDVKLIKSSILNTKKP